MLTDRIAQWCADNGRTIEVGKPNSIGYRNLAKILGASARQVRAALEEMRRGPAPVQTMPLEDSVRQYLRRHGRATLEQVCDAVDRGPAAVRRAVESLKSLGLNVTLNGGLCELSGNVAPGGEIVHPLRDFSHRWRKFGVCGDKHLCNRQARLDVLNTLYDIYEQEGITEVYDTGNWIDGEAGKINRHELLVMGLGAQIQYWIDNHPQRKGITTYFIAGDDHEGWYQQRECIEIGRYAQMEAERAGRNDLKYMGYLEADVRLAAENGSAWMKVMHPGGGTAYALSYTGQKAAESFQGGEKPAVLLQGHFHKMNFGFPREIYVIDSGTCCDQTTFMRKKRIAAHVGGWIVEMNQAPDGTINRFKAEFIHFYDRGYYTGKLRKFSVAA